MPSFNIIKEHTPKKTFRVASVIDSFDIKQSKTYQEFIGSIDLDFDWNIGIIFGASGTGKTTIAKEILGNDYYVTENYNSDSILDDMPSNCSIDEITKTFCAVGFGSVPSWLKPYSVLSNGEKMRVDMARSILEKRDCVVFDEFTSVVDRQVAKIGSMCIQKIIRKNNKKFIAVCCHYDVIDWLEADWVFNTNEMKFYSNKKKDQKLTLKYTKQQFQLGNVLKNITI